MQAVEETAAIIRGERIADVEGCGASEDQGRRGVGHRAVGGGIRVSFSPRYNNSTSFLVDMFHSELKCKDCFIFNIIIYRLLKFRLNSYRTCIV